MKETKGKSANSPINPNKRFWLGILIIAPAFVLITLMFYMQYSVSAETMITLKALINSEADSEKITAAIDAFDDVSTSNQSFFNILLAVFAAWIGAVVAFYFGSENLQQAQQTLQNVLSAKQEMTKKTIEDLLTELKEAKNVRKSKMSDSILQIRKELQTMTNILVVDEIDKPLGILYRWELPQYVGINVYADTDANDTKKLSEVVDKITDYITNKPWDKEKGIKNYATLSLKDNLLQAKEKMEEMAKSVDHLLSVRGLVEDKESRVIAIINFSNLTKGII